MSVARNLGFGLLGAVAGAAIGGGAGILGGLGYTYLAKDTDVAHYSSQVVALWMLGGIVVGVLLGAALCARWGR